MENDPNQPRERGAVDWFNDRANQVRNARNTLKNSKKALNFAKRFFGKKTNPAEQVAQKAIQSIAKKVIVNATKQLVMWILTLNGVGFLIFILAFLVIMFPFFGGTGEASPIPPGGNGNIPPPGPASSSISETAENMTRILLTNCPQPINRFNFVCARALFNGGVKFPEMAFNEIAISVLSYGDLQCVGFVNAVVAGATGVGLPKIGDARDYIRDIPGFTFVPKSNDTISAGDIPVWTDPSQHIAIAVEVTSPTLFRIVEANFDHAGGVTNTRWKGTENHFVGWLRKL